jgi:ubiquinone/menaquinone biosynthesis C-methylase UbiE
MTMNATADRDMNAYWDRAGRVWVEHQALLDKIMAPIAEAVVEAAGPVNGERVLDVGCGSGATTFAAAWRTGPTGRAVGVDISGALVELARRRAGEEGLEGVEFLLADAQTHVFATPFDAIVSRFGVMFFPDPVAAFANLRRALKPSGRLAFAAWRAPEENPLALVPLRAAAPFLPTLPAFEKDAPGRFAFADPDRVRRILEESGWRDRDRAAGCRQPAELRRTDDHEPARRSAEPDPGAGGRHGARPGPRSGGGGAGALCEGRPGDDDLGLLAGHGGGIGRFLDAWDGLSSR